MSDNTREEHQLLTWREVSSLTKMSRSAIYRNVKNKTFPAPIKIGPKSIRWRRDQLKEYIIRRPGVNYPDGDESSRA